MTELETLILNRYSERAFSDTPVPLDVVEHIVETALHAPSPSGRNPFYFVVVHGASTMNGLTSELERAFTSLREDCGDDPGRLKVISFYEHYSLFIRDAVALIFCYTNDRKSALSPLPPGEDCDAANLLSLGTVLQNIGLLCTEKGIGHCILSAPTELFPELFNRLFPTPGHLRLRCLMAMGYPAKKGGRKPKTIPTGRYVKVMGR